MFSADEAGLYWWLLPDKTHAVKGETCTGGKKSKERVTLLVCAMTGKFQRPRCFSGVTHLPTEYKANRNASSTKQIEMHG